MAARDVQGYQLNSLRPPRWAGYALRGSGPTSRMTDARLAQTGAAIITATKDISTSLGLGRAQTAR